VLINADVVQMQKAGLSEQIILTKIGTSITKFNTGTQDLIPVEGSRRERQHYQRHGAEFRHR
jgi:hypothetical protein